MLMKLLASALVLTAAAVVPLGSANAAPRPELSADRAATKVHSRGHPYYVARRAHGPLRYHRVGGWRPEITGYTRSCGWVYKEIERDREPPRWVRYRACVSW